MSEGVLIPSETFNKVVDYIQRRPFNEVANIIEEIRNTASIVDSSKVEEAPKEEEPADE